ncbi:hypothetical protein [Cobetia crustatorum]|uniref:hypothetical protein n=1 Tax=Cobetia crustatorum TaxID=553385 RepID=UPI0012EB5FE1|nr:hypothetical protein [Cobetia crustatorum]
MSWKSNDYIGMIKFFQSDKEFYLDKLLSGLIHCQTPEVYRISDMEGVSDRFESCIHSYRHDRNDDDVKITIKKHSSGEEIEITDVLSLTLYQSEQKDSWLSCWMSLRIPEDEEELENLKDDITRMKANFGNSFVFLPVNNVGEFFKRIEKSTTEKFTHCEVVYDGDRNNWGSFCKSLDYSYQREYRLSFGECSSLEKEPYMFSCPEGFSDIMYKNPKIKLESKDRSRVWLEI